MANFGNWIKSTIKRSLIYIIGVIVILAILAVGGFYMAKPYLNTIVSSQMEKRNIKADSADITMTGRVHMTNVVVPAPEGIKVTIGEATARPPVGPLSGAATLYNLDIERDKIHIHIPEISLNGIGEHGKDASIESHVLQLLNRFSLSSINAPTIEISVKKNNDESEKILIKDFYLSSFSKGRIGTISINGINTNFDVGALAGASNEQERLIAKSDRLSARNIDIAYAYSIFSGRAEKNEEGKVLFGAVELNNINIDYFNNTKPMEDSSKVALHLALKSFNSDGLSIKNPGIVPEDLLKEIATAAKAGNETDKKKLTRDLLSHLLASITSINAEVENADIATPKIKTSLASFRLEPKRWKNTIPEQLLVSLDGLSIDTTQLPHKELSFFKEMGYNSLDVSGKLEFDYNARRQTLNVNDMSFEVKNIASGQLTADISNVEEALFSGSETQALQAAEKIGVTNIHMQYHDYGFIDNFFNYITKIVDVSKEELYDDFYLVMTQSPALMLKDHSQAEGLINTLGKFARKPGTLTIDIKAKNSTGLTASDFQAAIENDLSVLLNKVDINAQSSE